MNKKPCLNCPDRYPGCSTECKKEDYLRERSRRERIKDSRGYHYKRSKTTAHWAKKGFGKQEG